MTHQYRQRIAVTVGANDTPATFTWRAMTYHVTEVLARWHLRDRWWRAAAPHMASGTSAAGGDAARLAVETAAEGCATTSAYADGDRTLMRTCVGRFWGRRPPGATSAASSPHREFTDSTQATPEPTASDRHYYRVCCAEGLLCELYFDAASGAWTLDRVLD